MKKQPKPQDTARREFLRTSAIAGAGASITAALPGAALADEPQAEAPKRSEKYRVTRHVADYYKTLS